MFASVKQTLGSWLEKPPPIAVGAFDRAADIAYMPEAESRRLGMLRSEIARTDRLLSDNFQTRLAPFEAQRTIHRKCWETAYILQALAERGLIRDGSRGLGFAVGRERIPAVLAAGGCRLTATDLGAGGENNALWADTNQWSGTLEDLTFPDICPKEVMAAQVEFRPVDMNDIPDDLTGYDFTWSTCSFEHCGSLQKGADFILRQMDCLRSGGLAVHTTEFNLSSNEETIETGATVIYRLRDIEDIMRRLTEAGHRVEPLDIRLGDHSHDRYVDRISRRTNTFPQKRHLRLQLWDWATTSIGLIITKG